MTAGPVHCNAGFTDDTMNKYANKCADQCRRGWFSASLTEAVRGVGYSMRMLASLITRAHSSRPARRKVLNSAGVPGTAAEAAKPAVVLII